MPADQKIMHPTRNQFERTLRMDVSAAASDDRRIELSFASAEPVRRWYGVEVLDTSAGAVRLDRINAGTAALLLGHDDRSQIGVVESARADGDGKLRAVVRLSKSALASEILEDIRDGIRSLVSVGYTVHEMVLSKSGDDGDEYLVTDWEPYEISIVSIPADATVGVGRSIDPASAPAQKPTTEKSAMTVTHQADTPAVQDPTQHITAERERAREIRAIAGAFNARERGDAAIDSGISVDAFRAQLLDHLGKSGAIRPAESPEIGMSRAEVQRYSFLRALMAVEDPLNAHKIAPYELECSRAAQNKRGKERESAITIPADVLGHRIEADDPLASATRNMARGATRDLNIGTNSAGGYLMPTTLLGASFIEMLRARLVIQRLGAIMLTDLSGNIAIPSQTGAATGYWVTEGSAPTESQQTLGQMPLVPRTVGAFTDYTRKLLMQQSVDVESFVRADLAAVIAQALDQAAISGPTGGASPVGIINTTGIGSVPGGTNGAAPTYAHMVSLEEQISLANADVASMSYLINSQVRRVLRTTQEFASTNGKAVYTKAAGSVDGDILGYTAATTNLVPSNLTKGTANGVCSAIILGNFADLVIGLWGGLDLMVDPYTLATSGGRRIIALQDADIGLRHVGSFAAMLDALTA